YYAAPPGLNHLFDAYSHDLRHGLMISRPSGAGNTKNSYLELTLITFIVVAFFVAFRFVLLLEIICWSVIGEDHFLFS
ncbi:MAG: hypothetical protein QOJ02_191, partial [Acidobacteriota bacterium]|nr:hypothetical protein [Acidobacteriota bacterium]